MATSSEARVAAPTVDGVAIPASADLARMRGERTDRLRRQMAQSGIDALLLVGTGNVHYATGAAMASVDGGRATLLRPVALVLADDPVAHLFTPYPDGAAGRIPADHVHPPLLVDLDDTVGRVGRALGSLLASRDRLAIDEEIPTLLQSLGQREIMSGQGVVSAARLVKTVDEIACIREAQRINEQAMAVVYEQLRPGLRQTDLTGVFLQHCFELGASGTGIDTIWQVMEPTLQAGPWSTTGHVAYPTPSTDRLLRDGDVLWVDSGILYEGYASDFGRTWIVGGAPSRNQQRQFERWLAVIDSALERLAPGVAGIELCRAAVAADGGREIPWLPHFYLLHGVGVGSAEMPMLGTDLGEQFDASVTLEPGMVVVLEPAIWDDGAGGYRAEEVYAVTDDGFTQLSDFSYAPFERPS